MNAIKEYKSRWVIYTFSQLDTNKKAAINRINKSHHKCFKCAVTASLHPEDIGREPFEKVTKNKPFKDRYI